MYVCFVQAILVIKKVQSMYVWFVQAILIYKRYNVTLCMFCAGYPNI